MFAKDEQDPRFGPQHHMKAGLVAYVCEPSTEEVKTGGPVSN